MPCKGECSEGKKIKEVYVAAFTFPGALGEIIYVAVKPHADGTYESRASVESEIGGVPGMLEICDAFIKGIREETGEAVTYRLLKFPGPPIELDPADIRGFEEFIWYSKKRH